MFLIKSTLLQKIASRIDNTKIIKNYELAGCGDNCRTRCGSGCDSAKF